jgi:hypothetical protein
MSEYTYIKGALKKGQLYFHFMESPLYPLYTEVKDLCGIKGNFYYLYYAVLEWGWTDLNKTEEFLRALAGPYWKTVLEMHKLQLKEERKKRHAVED